MIEYPLPRGRYRDRPRASPANSAKRRTVSTGAGAGRRGPSNEGDVVLDSLCGSGNFIFAAQKFGREWIGIDIPPSIALIWRRLKDVTCELRHGTRYQV
ncbi:MAG TPA: DNA methyltransferase [Allosphingosinicella sp.]|nr:DNA methyltransferase [Allosphingosinicella sp.]